jgi:hypothetical protein
MPGLMVGDLTAEDAGVDRAQPDRALERLEFPPDPAPVRAVQPAGLRYEKRVWAYINVELAGDGEGVLVIRRPPRLRARSPCKVP